MLRLGEFLDLRRWEWAAPYAPALAAHRRTLAQLGAGALQTGDWLVPARQSALAEPLEQHFAAARRVNYVKQATLLHRLIRRALDAGMAFAGYVDAEGKLVTPPGGPRGELWGWAARTRSPALLFRDAGASRRAVGGVEPLLFTPVFAFGANRLELLAEAAQGASLTAPELAAATRFLPPLYSTAHD
jgi:hypothetical protein